MGFSRQESWSGLPFPSTGGLLTQGSNLDLLHCRWILYCLSHQEHSLGSICFNHFSFCSSDPIISVILFLIAMILSSTSSSLPLNPSSDFFISVIICLHSRISFWFLFRLSIFSWYFHFIYALFS